MIDLLYDINVRCLVLGIGGAGVNAVQHMAQHMTDPNLTFVGVDTDVRTLEGKSVPHKIALGHKKWGVSSGGDMALAQQSLQEHRDELQALLDEHELVVVVAGLGGGTGTGALSIIAELIAELKKSVCFAVAMPFSFEGAAQSSIAQENLNKLAKDLHAISSKSPIFTVYGDDIIRKYGQVSFQDALNKSNDELMHVVQGLNIISSPTPVMNISFDNLESAFSFQGFGAVGMGYCNDADNPSKAQTATKNAVNALSARPTHYKIGKVLIYMTGYDVGINDHQHAHKVAKDLLKLDNSVPIHCGMVFDDTASDAVQVVIVVSES